MNQLLKILPIIFLSFISCKKDKKIEKILGSIAISDANSLIFCSAVSGVFASGDASDSLKLIKQTITDDFRLVSYLTEDGNDLGNDYIPDGIYTLNSNYFLLNVYRKADLARSIQSYTVNKTDGRVYQLNEAIIPHQYTNNSWIKGCPDGGFIMGNTNTFYIPDGTKICKLELRSDGTGTVSSILMNNPIFDADVLGNVLSGSTIELNDKSHIPFTVFGDKSFVVKDFNSGFYLIDLEVDTIRIRNVVLGSSGYTLVNKANIIQNSGDWNYLGNSSIQNSKASLLLFDKAILFIDSEEAKLISFDELSLKTISSFYVSNDALFIVGKNILDAEVFVKINPKPNPISFSDVMGPNSYAYHFMQISPEGSISFYARRLNSTQDVIGFLSSKSANIIDNEFNIKVKQVLPLK
jgi:hypothetical protein